MFAPADVTVTVALVSTMLRWVCTDQPVVDSERVPDPYACIGNGPGGGHATHALPALPVPPMFCMQDAPPWPVDPSPIGPSRFDSTIRRWPKVVSLPVSIRYADTDDTPGPPEMLLVMAPIAPSAV